MKKEQKKILCINFFLTLSQQKQGDNMVPNVIFLQTIEECVCVCSDLRILKKE